MHNLSSSRVGGGDHGEKESMGVGSLSQVPHEKIEALDCSISEP